MHRNIVCLNILRVFVDVSKKGYPVEVNEIESELTANTMYILTFIHIGVSYLFLKKCKFRRKMV